MNLCVIVAAGGRSERFGDSDKLAQDLGGRPVLVRTVEAFAKLDAVRSIVVAGPPEGSEAHGVFRDRFGPVLGFHGATIVGGGATARWETVRNALAAVPDDATHVAVHDAARPVVPPKMLERLLEAARSADAVIPAVPIHGTVKRLDAEVHEVADVGDESDALADLILEGAGRPSVAARAVIETIPRDGLVEVQTPQIFALPLLRRAYAEAELDGATDDAMLVERLGLPVLAVAGDATNLKITTPEDLRLARAILGVAPPPDRPAHLRF